MSSGSTATTTATTRKGRRGRRGRGARVRTLASPRRRLGRKLAIYERRGETRSRSRPEAIVVGGKRAPNRSVGAPVENDVFACPPSSRHVRRDAAGRVPARSIRQDASGICDSLVSRNANIPAVLAGLRDRFPDLGGADRPRTIARTRSRLIAELSAARGARLLKTICGTIARNTQSWWAAAQGHASRIDLSPADRARLTNEMGRRGSRRDRRRRRLPYVEAASP